MDYNYIISCLDALWSLFVIILNSSPFISIIAALFAAFLGAHTAQKIAERNKQRDELMKEIRSINVAIALVGSIANTFFELKKKHVRPMKLNFDAMHAGFLEHPFTSNTPFHLIYDLRFLPAVFSPDKNIQELVFTRVTPANRAICLVTALSDTLVKLNDSIDKRNQLIQLFKEDKFPSGADLCSMYLGLPYGNGTINQEYPDTINSISSYVDDVIFFSTLLCRDLNKYGLKVSDKFKRLTKETPPSISEWDFSQSISDGLIPPDDDYPTWFSAFFTSD